MTTPINSSPDDNDSVRDALSTYFAVQLHSHERAMQVIEAVMKTAKDVGIMFQRLEMLDTITIGTLSFVRMRSEMINPAPILDRLFAGKRAVVHAVPKGDYTLRTQNRVGKVAQLVMHATPKLGQSQMFQGTKFKFWDRQFSAA